MITQQLVWDEIWPVVEGLVRATLMEEPEKIGQALYPGKPAARLYGLFGPSVFDILLKTVLGRDAMGLSRAIDAAEAGLVLIEYVWPDPELTDGSYTAADVVSVALKQYRGKWRITAINPANVDLPLTEPRAQGILISSRSLSEKQSVPQEPWILPVALYGGSLQIPLQPDSMVDDVERLLLPGLQHRTYGALSVAAGQRLWRDFRRRGQPTLQHPASWAAAAEFIMSEQTLREISQAAVAKLYECSFTSMPGRVRQIKDALKIKPMDRRYSFDQFVRLKLNESE